MNLVLYRNCNVSLAAHILTRCCMAMNLVRVPMLKSFSASLRCTGARKDGKTIFIIRLVLLARAILRLQRCRRSFFMKKEFQAICR